MRAIEGGLQMHTARLRTLKAALIGSLLAFPLLAPACPAAAAPAMTPTVTYTSCAKVKAASSGGIAESKAAARRVKGKQMVSARLYQKYRKWDRNKDGVICGPKDSTSNTITRTGSATVVCPDGMELVGANAPALTGRETSEWTPKLTTTSTSASFKLFNNYTGEIDFPAFTIYCRRF